jgi:hypothetical protein
MAIETATAYPPDPCYARIVKYVGLSLADDAEFLGCHFAPGRAQNDIQ